MAFQLSTWLNAASDMEKRRAPRTILTLQVSNSTYVTLCSLHLMLAAKQDPTLPRCSPLFR